MGEDYYEHLRQTLPIWKLLVLVVEGIASAKSKMPVTVTTMSKVLPNYSAGRRCNCRSKDGL